MIAARVGARWVAGVLLAAAGAGAEESDATRGAALLAPFKQELRAALGAGLSRGPIEAVEACRLGAPEIAASLSRDGVRVGRSSDRLRNPANAPPAWVSPILEAYLADASHREPRIQALAEGRLGYVEPILLQPLCATCHGESIAPELESRIRELYPQDRAVGFGVGDLRGVFWLEFAAQP